MKSDPHTPGRSFVAWESFLSNWEILIKNLRKPNDQGVNLRKRMTAVLVAEGGGGATTLEADLSTNGRVSRRKTPGRLVGISVG